MAIDFPNSPTLNQTFTVGDRTWTWNGTSWKLTSYGVRGLPGIQSSATPPSDTSLLWADTATNSSAGIVPSGGSLGQVLTKNSATNYDAGWASVGSAARPLLTGGAYLSGSGLVLGGLSGNYASTPDTAALSITGDIEIIVKATATASNLSGTLVGKWQSSHSFLLSFDGGAPNYLRFYITPDGVSAPSVAVSVSATAWSWWKLTREQSTGNCNFYGSNDGTTWTQIGTTQVLSAGTAIFDGNANLQVGSDSTFYFNGTIYRAIVKNGIGGTTVFDADFSTQTADALAFTESSSNAATVTINTTRYFYGIPGLDGTILTTQSYPANYDAYFPFNVNRSIIVDMFGFEITGAPSYDGNTYFAIYAADNNLQPTGAPVATASKLVAASTTGIIRIQITPVTLSPGQYLLAFNQFVGAVYRVIYGGYSSLLSSMGSAGFSTGFVGPYRVAAAFPTNPAAWTGSYSSNYSGRGPVHLRWKAAT